MRLPPSGTPSPLHQADQPDSEPPPPALRGSWSATRWQYRSRLAPERVVDLICDLDGSVTLSLSADSFILSWAFQGTQPHCVAGALRQSGDRLELRPDPDRPGEVVHYRLGPSELALSSDDSAWMFDGNGSDGTATWVGVFVRV